MKTKLMLLIACIFFLIFGCSLSPNYLLTDGGNFMLALQGGMFSTENITTVTENVSAEFSITTSYGANPEGTVRVYSKLHDINTVDTRFEYGESLYTFSDYYDTQSDIYITGTLEAIGIIEADVHHNNVNNGSFVVTGCGFTEATIYWTEVIDPVTDELLELSGMLNTDKRDFDITEIYLF